jgi:hypothetical protein
MTCPSIREIEFTSDRPSWPYPMNDDGGKGSDGGHGEHGVAKHVLRSLKLHDFDLKEVDASRAWSSLGPPELRKSKCRKLLTRKNHTLEAATRLLRVAMKLVVKRPDRSPPREESELRVKEERTRVRGA